MPKVQPIPSASSGRGKRGRRSRVSTSLAEINVVPLVDVMLVLLIIFMVAAPMMTQGMPVNLPQARKTSPLTPSQVTVTIPAAYAKDQVVQIGNDEVPVKILAERMRQTMLTRTDKSVLLRADGSVNWKDVIYVMDRLKDAGVEKIGASTRPAGSKQ
jgi:biopolymer transport protein TolR